MQSTRHRKPTVSLRLETSQLEEIDAWVRRAGMKSRTDLVARAIDSYLQDLKETKVVVVRDWTKAKAKTAIRAYLKGRRSTHVSDIIESLGMDPDTAFAAVDELLKEGAIDRAARTR